MKLSIQCFKGEIHLATQGSIATSWLQNAITLGTSCFKEPGIYQMNCICGQNINDYYHTWRMITLQGVISKKLSFTKKKKKKSHWKGGSFSKLGFLPLYFSKLYFASECLRWWSSMSVLVFSYRIHINKENSQRRFSYPGLFFLHYLFILKFNIILY